MEQTRSAILKSKSRVVILKAFPFQHNLLIFAMPSHQTRRSFLLTGAVAASCPLLLASTATAQSGKSSGFSERVRYSLNTGTLRGFNLGVEEEIDTAAKAGYTGVELWIDRLTAFVNNGGKLSDLKKRLDDHGMQVENGMAFFCWASNDEEKRKAGIEQMKREIAMLREIGCTRIAATAAGTTGERLDDFATLGQRYREILEIGTSMDVIPQLEVWGGSKTLTTLSDAVAVATAAGHRHAALLLDAYHLYKGGSSFEGLRLLNGRALQVFHINDYPADPPRETIQDRHRVYPGSGVCPLPQILGILDEIGFCGALSFEIFNPEYWKNDTPLSIATKGLEAMRDITRKIGT